MTQTFIENLVDELVSVYSGHSIAFPNGSYPNQCTVPVQAFYIPRITGQTAPTMAHDRADGWGNVFPYQLENFFTHEAYQQGKSYPKGSIMMWNSPPNSHIAIVVSHDGSNVVRVFQQNADPDGAPCGVYNRAINNQWHTCTFVLIPKVQAAAVIQPVPMWTLDSSFTPKQVRTNKNPTHKWGLNWEFDYMSQHPVAERPQGDVFLAVAKVIHVSGHHYYRDNIDDANGYEVADCDDYTPPKTTPAAPDKGKLAIKYDVVAVIKQYPSYEDALRDTAATGTTKKKTYYQREQKGNFYCLADDNMTNDTFWIDGKDNVITPEESKVPPRITEVVTAAAEQIPKPPVVVTPPTIIYDSSANPDHWKTSYAPFNMDGSPEYFNSLNNVDMEIFDLSNPGTPQVLHAFSENIPIVGTIEKDRILYGLPKRSKELYKFYAIPMHLLEGQRGSLFDTYKTYEEKVVTNTLKIADRINQARYRFTKWLDGIKSTKPGKDT